MKTDPDSARVPVPPPLLLLASIFLGVALQYLHPVHFVAEALRWILGGSLLGFGVGVILYCARMFMRAKTAIEPWKTTSHIVTSGPYRWSRNPIYFSFVLVGLGMAILLNNLWVALMQGLLIMLLNRVVIRREERYLESKFGDSYRAYKGRVRRWI